MADKIQELTSIRQEEAPVLKEDYQSALATIQEKAAPMLMFAADASIKDRMSVFMNDAVEEAKKTVFPDFVVRSKDPLNLFLDVMGAEINGVEPTKSLDEREKTLGYVNWLDNQLREKFGEEYKEYERQIALAKTEKESAQGLHVRTSSG